MKQSSTANEALLVQPISVEPRLDDCKMAIQVIEKNPKRPMDQNYLHLELSAVLSQSRW